MYVHQLSAQVETDLGTLLYLIRVWSGINALCGKCSEINNRMVPNSRTGWEMPRNKVPTTQVFGTTLDAIIQCLGQLWTPLAIKINNRRVCNKAVWSGFFCGKK